MGKTITPTYRIEYRTNVDGNMVQTLCWPKGKRANAENLEAVRKMYNESFQPGGCNAHTASERGVVHVTWMRLVHQATGRTVAEARMPMFEVA